MGRRRRREDDRLRNRRDERDRDRFDRDRRSHRGHYRDRYDPMDRDHDRGMTASDKLHFMSISVSDVVDTTKLKVMVDQRIENCSAV